MRSAAGEASSAMVADEADDGSSGTGGWSAGELACANGRFGESNEDVRAKGWRVTPGRDTVGDSPRGVLAWIVGCERNGQ